MKNLAQRFVQTLALVAITSVTAGSARAFNADLQAQSFGSTNWISGHISGWAELDPIPARVTVAGGPASNQTVTVNFPHDGIQNLYSFTPSANVVITSGPTLSAPTSGNWSYSFKVKLTDNQPGSIEFRMRLGAGAHRFTGSTLQVDGTPGLSKLFIFKPSPKAGAPDLAIVKNGPATANPGSIIAYSLNYSNRVSASTATGVQIVDTLPDSVSFVDSSNGGQALGNQIIWDLADVARGSHGTVTYRVAVTNALTTGFSFQNNAVIAEAQDDANYADNSSSVTTVVTGNCIPPAILESPAAAAVCAGDSASFSVLANGSETLAYQWRKDGVDIAGATSDTLALNSLAVSDSGNYDVVVSNLCGSQTSAAGHLIVGGALITTQPANVVACPGDNTAFNVIASGDALTYQWRKDGVDIAGATNALLEITADAGNYDVVINSNCGSTTSDIATLTINQPASITSNPSDATVCSGDFAQLSASADGTGISYQWRKDGVDIAGANSSSYATTDAGSYDVAVTGTCGAPAISAAATVTVNQPPLITQDPVGASVTVGEPVNLSVTATGTGLSYQWRKDGNAIAGANAGTFSIAAVTEADAGSYDVVINGVCGSAVSSSPVSVTVSPAPVNHDPVAVDDNLAIGEDSGTHDVNVLGNDSDSDGDALAITGITQGAHGFVAINGDQVSYTPSVNFNGTDSFTYTISDGNGGSASATVHVSVSAVNDAAVAANDSYEMGEDDTLTVAAPGVLGNDHDAEGATLTATLTSSPTHGTLTLNSDGSFIYVPADNYNGPDSFTYRASDGALDSNIATVTIDVLAVSGAGDIDLYVKTGKAHLNWAALHHDTLAIRGQINPRGMKTDLTGATVALQVNGVDIIAPQTLDAKGKSLNCRLKSTNGRYSVKLTGANLRGALGLANTAGTGLSIVTVRLTINGADLEVPITTAELECPFKTTANKASQLKFNFRKNRTLSGAFNANKTTGSVSSKAEVVTIKGAITAEGVNSITPNGDITIHAGNSVMTVPLAMLSNVNGVWQYNGTGVAGLKSFLLSNTVRAFKVSVASFDVGLPAAGAGAPTKHDLPLQIQVPTADGTMVFESIIELKRPSNTSTHWKR